MNVGLSLQSPLAISLWVSGWACLAALLFGTLIAWILAKFQFRGKLLLEAFVTLPLVLPPTVLGYYLLVLLGQRGLGPWFEQVLGFRFVFAFPGAIAAATISALPLVVLTVRVSLWEISHDIENAARIDGCNEWRLLRHIYLPLSWRGILAGGTLGFLRALGEFGAVLMVAGNIPRRTQTMSMAIYDAVQANDIGRANELALIVSVVAFTLLFLTLRISRRVEQTHPTT